MKYLTYERHICDYEDYATNYCEALKSESISTSSCERRLIAMLVTYIHLEQKANASEIDSTHVRKKEKVDDRE